MTEDKIRREHRLAVDEINKTTEGGLKEQAELAIVHSMNALYEIASQLAELNTHVKFLSQI
jgi:hypothetical protein